MIYIAIWILFNDNLLIYYILRIMYYNDCLTESFLSLLTVSLDDEPDEDFFFSFF